MSLSIIHFSDIHIKNNNDLILTRIDQLKKACSAAIESSKDVLLLISGDIAFSGQEQQYELAADMINDITEYLANQKMHTFSMLLFPETMIVIFPPKAVIEIF